MGQCTTSGQAWLQHGQAIRDIKDVGHIDQLAGTQSSRHLEVRCAAL